MSDNSGRVAVRANAAEVLVEGCRFDHPRNKLAVDKGTAGVLLRHNRFSARKSAGYAGDGLRDAVIVEGGP